MNPPNKLSWLLADVLGWQQTLQLLLQPLQQLAGKPFDWRLAEASLYCIRYDTACLCDWLQNWYQQQ